MPIVRKAKIKCPNKSCKMKIYSDRCIGVAPRLLALASVYFRCRKCDTVFYVNIPVYVIHRFLQTMGIDPDIRYGDGEVIENISPITAEEEGIFVNMMQEQPMELIKSLMSIDKIDLDKFREQ